MMRFPCRPCTCRLGEDLRITWSDLRQLSDTNPRAIVDAAEFRDAVTSGRVRARHDGRLEVVGYVVDYACAQ